MSISAVILTKNSERTLRRCLESVSFADELIVIDDNSTDDTVNIAKSVKAKIFEQKLDGDFSKQRNLGISKASGEFVFFVDSDEFVSKELASEIQSSLKESPDTDGFLFKRHDIFLGRTLTHGEIGAVRLMRLGRKGKGVFEGAVHEVWKINGHIKEFQSPLLHYSHESVGSFIEDINVYSTIRAQELYENGEQSRFGDVVVFPAGKFLINMFYKKGFLDGIEGLIVAILMSFHSFLVRGKLWKLNHETSNRRK